jgi:hypothetical protein
MELRQGANVLGNAAVDHDVLLNADSEGACSYKLTAVYVYLESTFQIAMAVYRVHAVVHFCFYTHYCSLATTLCLSRGVDNIRASSVSAPWLLYTVLQLIACHVPMLFRCGFTALLLLLQAQSH